MIILCDDGKWWQKRYTINTLSIKRLSIAGNKQPLIFLWVMWWLIRLGLMENNQLKHGENCCPSHWNLMRIFLSASSREEHSHNILFILQRFLFDLWWVTRQGLTVLLKDTLTGKPSVNRTVWSVGIYCQRRMCAWVMRVIHLWYEHTNIQTDTHTHTMVNKQ